MYSEYNTNIPGNYEYNIKLVGGRKLFINDSKVEYACIEVGGGGSANCTLSRYVMKNIPAFVEEQFMTSQTNYLSRIEYELNTIRHFDGTVDKITKSWKDLDTEIRKNTDFGRMLRRDNLVKGLIDDNDLLGKSQLEKAKYIFDFVRNNYKANDIDNLFFDVTLKNPLQNESGTVAEVNTLLLQLLRVHDIDAKALLSSTRNNGFITTVYPVITDYNYLLVHVKIDNNIHLLDAANSYVSFGQIPFKCLNRYGRLLNLKKGSSWFDIDSKQASSSNFRGEMHLKNNTLEGSFEFRNSDQNAFNYKKAFFSDSENFMSNIVKTKPDIDIKNIDYNGLKKSDSILKINFDISAPIEIIGNRLYVNPFIIDFFKSNPFTLQERSYPVDFGVKQSYTYATKINFGDNYIVEELPESNKISLPQNTGTLITNYQLKDNSLTLFFKVTLNKSIYEPSYYDSLKQLFNVLVDTQKNTLIVFSKKE